MIGEAEIDQHAAGIGGELQAGARFGQPLGFFQHDDAEAVRGQRQRGRQSADARTCNDNGAGRRHGRFRRPFPSARIRAAGPRRARAPARSDTA